MLDEPAARGRIYAIISQVLDAPAPDLQCNFFELGGNSLAAIMLINEINSEFGINVSLQRLFESHALKDFIDEIIILAGTRTI